MLLAAGVVVLSFRRSARWPALAAAAIVGGSVVSAAMVATVTLPAPGWVVDPVTHIPTGDLFPGYIRLLTPFFNITGAFALSLGAIYSAYVFMPKRRLVRYEIRRDRGVGFFARNLLLAPVAITVNFVASLPGAFRALFAGQDQQPRPRDDPHRHRGHHPGHHERHEPVRRDQRLLRR